MKHYHGTPCGATREDVVKFLRGRHALIPFLRSEDIGAAAEVCQSFVIDNSAYTAWKKGVVINWNDYYDFVDLWRYHPAFDWAAIPDVIDGNEDDNDRLIEEWLSRFPVCVGIPVWHMHESLERLLRLIEQFQRIALGSSGEFSSIGTDNWWRRIDEAMEVICLPDGRPRKPLHGMRMLNPEVFTKLPLASADSTNAVRNSSSFNRFGMYVPPSASARMTVIAERIEAFQSPGVWRRRTQEVFSLFN